MNSRLAKAASSLLFFLGCVLLLSSSASDAGPLSERILIAAPYNGFSKLFICRNDGRDLQRFGRIQGQLRSPSFDPSHGRVFFVRDENRLSQICSTDAGGHDFIVHLEGRAHFRSPSPCPDGRTLLLTTDLWGAFELASLDLETQTLTRLTYDQGTNTHPRVAPNGRQAVYLSRRRGRAALYILDLETRKSRPLTRSSFNEGPGNWNHNGTRIIATRNFPPQQTARLIEIDLAHNAERSYLPEKRGVSSPCYSPDSRQILFVHDDEILIWDPSDTAPEVFPLTGTLAPSSVEWITVGTP